MKNITDNEFEISNYQYMELKELINLFKQRQVQKKEQQTEKIEKRGTKRQR